MIDRSSLSPGYRRSELTHSCDTTILADLLRVGMSRHGASEWTIATADVWCHVTPTNHRHRPHGWKLHIAATPLSAPLVLARVVDILVAEECGFKFAGDLRRVAQLVDGRCDRSSAGKFLTAYPADDEQFRRLAHALHAATADLAGPRILSDQPFRPASVVHYRYGEFRGERVFTDDGVFETHVYDPAGHRFTDQRVAWFVVPDWAAPPFDDAPAPVSGADSVLLADRFRVTRAIRQANKGGVYRAVDNNSASEVVVKQARAHISPQLNGTDVRDVLRREAAMLEQLRPLGVAAAKVALFEQQGDLFLVEELVAGDAMHVWAAHHRADAGLLVAPLISLVQQVHDAGFVLCDLKPQNVMVGPDRRLRLIDVEYVARVGDTCCAATEGYGAPEVLAALASTKAPPAWPILDCYSLGATILHLITGLDGRWLSGGGRVLDAIAADHPGLSAYQQLVDGLTRPDPGTRWTLPAARRWLGAPTRAFPAGPRSAMHHPARKRPVGPTVGLLQRPVLERFLDDGIAKLCERDSRRALPVAA